MINWRNNIKIFQEKYHDNLSSVFMVGSGVYTEQFNEDSDIDLVCIIQDTNEWDFVCREFLEKSQVNNFLNETTQSYLSKNAHYFCLKFTFQGIQYSADFITQKSFEKFIQDFNQTDTIEYYKATNKPQLNKYEFGCGEKKIIVPKKNILYEHAVLVSSPLFIKKDGFFYMGILLDKFLTGYNTLWDNIGAEHLLRNFCREGIIRVLKNENIRDISDVLLGLNRYNAFPKEYRLHLIKQFEGYMDNHN